MSRRVPVLLLALAVAAASSLLAQQPAQNFGGSANAHPHSPPASGPQTGSHPFSGPAHPIVPNTPAAQRVIRPPVMRNAPFQLTADEQHRLMAVLSGWERASAPIDLLRCQIEILEYDLTFPLKAPAAPGQPQQVRPNHVWQGELKYQAPDKGWFEAKCDNAQQKWVVDGKSVFQFDFAGRKIVRRDLPPELRGAGIGDGPLPFFFGAKADKLARRYFMRLTTPAHLTDKQVWIEAYPRFQFDAGSFRRATVILDVQTAMPVAVEVYSPSGNERSVYKFINPQVGRNLLEKLFNQDLFQVTVPSGWQMVVNPGANGGQAAGPARSLRR